MLSRLKVGDTWLSPIEISNLVIAKDSYRGYDLSPPVNESRNLFILSYLKEYKAGAYLEISWKGGSDRYGFILESKARSTPQSIHQAMDQARKLTEDAKKRDGEAPFQNIFPAIQVPYLTPESLAMLEEEGVSGVDLCGNGVVIVPGQLLVLRTGSPNQFPDSRTTSNPYRGKSSLIARTLLKSPSWKTLSSLADAITQLGGKLSLAQASKALKAIEEDLIVRKSSNSIALTDPIQLLEKLTAEWDPEQGDSDYFTFGEGKDWARALSSAGNLAWGVTGESSAPRYVSFAQAGPIRVAVDDLGKARRAIEEIGGKSGSVPSFADIELCESQEPGFYFDTQVDENGIRWSSALQSYLELQSGDARQKETATDLRVKIIKEFST